MKITIKEPTKAYLFDFTMVELNKLQKQFTFTRTSILFQLGKHKKNRWWRRKDQDGWDARLEELRSQLKGCVVQGDGGSQFIRPGSIPYIEDIQFTVEDTIKYPEFKPLPWTSDLEFVPYTYQLQAVENLIRVKHGNVALPTGTGKSLILLLLAKQMGLKIVIVTPSKSIFNELLIEFQKRLGKKYVGGYGDGKKDIKKKITIAIGKSLTMLKDGSEAKAFFEEKEVMAVDESHTFGADQLENVCHGVLANIPYRFFVSATQKRGDGTEIILQSIIGKTVLEMSLEEAIQKGFLCPLEFTVLKVFSPSNLKKTDPIECKRVHFLYNTEIAKLSAKIANASWQLKQESTLILVEELRQIKMVVDLLKVPYGYVHSSSKKDAAEWGLDKVKLQEQVDKFNNGEIRVLIGTKAIATGTNIYPTHNTINFMGGGSEIRTKQGPMGRSTRKLEISKFKDLHKPKPFTRIFDFDVSSQPILEKQLEKRIGYYGESGGKISYH